MEAGKKEFTLQWNSEFLSVRSTARGGGIAQFHYQGKMIPSPGNPHRVVRLALTVRVCGIFGKFAEYAEYQIVSEYSVHL